jgi:hypothetical protein
MLAHEISILWAPTVCGGGKERGEHGGTFVGLTRARVAVWWLGDDDEVAVVEKVNDGGAQARREGDKRRGRCSEKQRGSPPFIGAGRALGRWQRAVTAGLMAIKPLMAGGG